MTKTMTINENITVTYIANGKFDRQMKAEAKRQEAIRKELEIENQLWEYLQTLTPDHPEYSDVFKEVYGFRPRG